MKKHIPNILTLLNLFCGLIALYCLLIDTDYYQAFYWLVGGIIFDFFDGLVARVLKVSSPLGVQLDSLADVVTSGVVPGFVMFLLLRENTTNDYIPFAGFLITLASAYRLARFNIDTRQSSSFIGLPTPANALMICSIPFLIEQKNVSVFGLLFWVCFSSFLLNSSIRMFSLKMKTYSLAQNGFKYGYIAISIGFLLFFGLKVVPMLVLLYGVVSLLETFFNNIQNK